jgi:opacity protein-like surface antigen
MKTILKTLLLVLLVAQVAYAQGPVVAGIAPVLEAGVGYSYVDAGVPSQSRLGMNGIQLVGNADISRRFGVAAELGYARSFDAYSSGRSADIMTYMAGPVFYAVRKQKVNVFAHVLLGAARETGINYEPNGQIVLGYTNRFAWAGGAGVQYRISRTFAIRVAGDYLRTSFFNSNVQLVAQTNFRPSVSLIYTFGEGRE